VRGEERAKNFIKGRGNDGPNEVKRGKAPNGRRWQRKGGKLASTNVGSGEKRPGGELQIMKCCDPGRKRGPSLATGVGIGSAAVAPRGGNRALLEVPTK